MFDEILVSDSVVEFVNSDAFERILDATSYTYQYRDDVALYAPLVFVGAKTGGLTTIRGMAVEEAREMFEDVGFMCKIREWNRSDEVGCSVYYTRNEEALEDLDMSSEDAAFGRFLGVPEEDNRWMDESDTVDSVNSIPEFLELTEDDVPNLRYARLVSWLCRPTEERLDATISIGKSWYDFAVRLEDKSGYSGAREYAEYEMTQFGAWYTVLITEPSWYKLAFPFRVRLWRYFRNIVR